ncbi:hypothetical protein [Pyrodictium abyssi]|uniref:Uncharacterized protein n=1 Tax=Pyrodictium abyssi TaxID=54256 RepID=A0ABN6ZWB3_9CREN|nr:hypothetical protein PABY_21250 [Pyrodictium abyssi]
MLRGIGTVYAGLIMLLALASIAVYIAYMGRTVTQAIHEQQQLYERARFIAEHANISSNVISLPEPADIIVVDPNGIPHVAVNVTTVTLPWPADQSKIYVAKRGNLRVGAADPVASSVAAMASVASAPLETANNTANVDTESLVGEAVREVLLVQYGPVLQPVWFAGPLLPVDSVEDVARAAGDGPLPGVNTDPEKAQLYRIAGLPVRDSVESSERDLGCCGCGELYVRRRVLEPIAGGLLRLEHREARVYACADIYEKYRWKPKIGFTKEGLLYTTSEIFALYRGRYWRWMSSISFPIPFNDYDHSASWLSGGAVGAIYIPFLVTTESKSETITLLLLPRDPVSAAVNETVTGWRAQDYCGVITSCTYTSTLALPVTHVSVKLHLLPPNTYDPGKLVVARGMASQVDPSWQARVQEALYTETIRIEGRNVARLDHPVAVTITIGPELVKRLGPTATAAVAVLEVSYAAWAGAWVSRFHYVPGVGSYAMVGTELLLYIAHSHTETANANELLAPTTLRLEPVAEARPVERIVLDRKTYTASRTIVDYMWGDPYYSTFTITYNETLVLEDPGLVLYTVEPGSQLTVSIEATQPTGTPVELDYTATPVPFPRSLLDEVLEEGAKPLIIT